MFYFIFYNSPVSYPRANGMKRRSGRKPGQGLLIPHSFSEVQSRCSWALGSEGITFLALWWSIFISILWWTIVPNNFDWQTRLFYSFPIHKLLKNDHLLAYFRCFSIFASDIVLLFSKNINSREEHVFK